MTLTGTAAIDGTGNELANTITGNSGNNVLDGGADALVDTLDGGAGNDTYVLADGSDVSAMRAARTRLRPPLPAALPATRESRI